MVGNVFEVNKLEDITQEQGSLAQPGIGAHNSGWAQRGNATYTIPANIISHFIRCATG